MPAPAPVSPSVVQTTTAQDVQNIARLLYVCVGLVLLILAYLAYGHYRAWQAQREVDDMKAQADAAKAAAADRAKQYSYWYTPMGYVDGRPLLSTGMAEMQMRANTPHDAAGRPIPFRNPGESWAERSTRTGRANPELRSFAPSRIGELHGGFGRQGAGFAGQGIGIGTMGGGPDSANVPGGTASARVPQAQVQTGLEERPAVRSEWKPIPRPSGTEPRHRSP